MADLVPLQKHSRGEVMQFQLIPCLRIKGWNGRINNNDSSVVTSLETGMGVEGGGKVRRNSNTALNVIHHALSHTT